MRQAISALGEVALQGVFLHWLTGGLLVLLVAATLRAAPQLNAATRFRLWWLALVITAALPALALLPSPLSINASARVASALSTLTGTSAESIVDNSPWERGAARPASPNSGATTTAPDATANHRRTTTHRRVGAGAIIGLAITLAWLLLSTWRALQLIRALLSTAQLKRASQPAANASAAELHRLSRQFDLRRTPGLRKVQNLAGPVCAGLFKPWIAIPSSWPGNLSASAQRHALLHELGHIQRRDPYSLLVQRIAEVVLSLHPAAWLISRHLDLERESACDDWAIGALGGEPHDYGESLLAVAAQQTRQSSTRHFATAYTTSPSQLHRRMLNMIDQHRNHQANIKWIPLLVACLLLGVAAMASASLWPTPPPFTTAALLSYQPGTEFTSRSADAAPLYPAVRSGDVHRVRQLVERGEDLNELWPGDGSPLIVAARRGDAPMVRELLALGAAVDLGIRGDGNPLIQASLRGHDEVVDTLLQHGAEIDLHVPGDDTPLINAARAGHPVIVAILLRAGADPDLTGDLDRDLQELRTPLNQAREGGHDEAIRLLLAAGA